MVFTAAQTLAFFTQDTQMAIPRASIQSLRDEGIMNVSDLAEFTEKKISSMAANFRRAPGGPVIFGAKSEGRLVVAANAVRYYGAVGRPISSANMQWDPVLKNFEQQFLAIKAMKDQTDPDTPKITKALPVMKWAEAFRDVLHRCVGVRNIPLAYVIRAEDVVPVAPPALANGFPHSEDAGSVERELIMRASHLHPNYRVDNDKVYGKMEEATRGTTYAASIKPFGRRRDGRAAYLAIISQYAGIDKWTIEINKFDSILHNERWKGTGNYSLDKFCALHRNANEQLREASNHVPYQLPEEYTRVGYLLNAIECADPSLQAAIAHVEADNHQDGLRFNFESAVAYITPKDPVARRLNNRKRDNTNISDTKANEVNVGDIRSGIGKTGVHLRFHEPAEYSKLNKAQRTELFEWRQTPEGKAAVEKEKATWSLKNGNKSKRKRLKKGNVSSISAVAEKVFEDKISTLLERSSEEEKKRAESKAALVGALEDIVGERSGASDTKSLEHGKDFLVSILKRAKQS